MGAEKLQQPIVHGQTIEELKAMQALMTDLNMRLDEIQTEINKETKSHNGSAARDLTCQVAGLDEIGQQASDSAVETRSQIKDCRVLIGKISKLIELKKVDITEHESIVTRAAQEMARCEEVQRESQVELDKVQKE